MATPPGQGDLEVLEQGTGSPLLASGRARVLLVVLIVLAVGAALVDRQVRRAETVQVARCVEATTGAVTEALGRVSVMAGYVRPALAGPPPPRLRRQLLHLISVSAGPGAPRLRLARSRCAATDVWPVHDSLRRTRSDCLRLLDGQLSYLADVAADGLRGYGARGVPPGRCGTG